jgi:hypothetical protein
MSGPEPSGPAVERAETRELRFAVVLYGGVSLAIYMHGVTKEIQKLVDQVTTISPDDTALRIDVAEGGARVGERRALRAYLFGRGVLLLTRALDVLGDRDGRERQA